MNTKYCKSCENNLSLDNFSPNKARYDGLQGYCTSCMKKYRKDHYSKNKKAYINRAKEKRKFLKEFSDRLKRISGCTLCKEKRWWVLEYHHLDPTNKDGNISKIIQQGSIKNLKEEIRKCQIVCANCHRDIHYRSK